MKKQNPLLAKRKYMSVEDVAAQASVAVSDLVHLAANNVFPLYTLADNWPVCSYVVTSVGVKGTAVSGVFRTPGAISVTKQELSRDGEAKS